MIFNILSVLTLLFSSAFQRLFLFLPTPEQMFVLAILPPMCFRLSALIVGFLYLFTRNWILTCVLVQIPSLIVFFYCCREEKKLVLLLPVLVPWMFFFYEFPAFIITFIAIKKKNSIAGYLGIVFKETSLIAIANDSISPKIDLKKVFIFFCTGLFVLASKLIPLLCGVQTTYAEINWAELPLIVMWGLFCFSCVLFGKNRRLSIVLLLLYAPIILIFSDLASPILYIYFLLPILIPDDRRALDEVK